MTNSLMSAQTEVEKCFLDDCAMSSHTFVNVMLAALVLSAHFKN